MAKTFATVLGIGLLLVGVAGFIMPGMLGMHLDVAHNSIHLISGALALYFGLKGSLSAARTFCFAFGAVYALLGVTGFIMGASGTRLLAVIPNHLVLGTADHIVHIILGLAFIAGGAATKVSGPARVM